MKSTGLVLAAGGIAAVNELLFSPLAASTNLDSQGKVGIAANFNWRIIPATLVLAFALGGLEKLNQKFAIGLAGLTLLSVLIVPVGNTGTPLENIGKTLGYTK